MKKRIHQINLFRKFPHDVQKEVFSLLIEKGKNTSFGEDHKFHKINSIVDFRKQVPVRTYEELFSYINRVRESEKDVLWPGKVYWFARSSGTTNDKSKFIPITRDSLEECHFKGGKDMLSLYCNNFPETNLYNGKGLMLGGSLEQNMVYNYTDGDLSAILINNFPFWVNMHRSPDLQTALLKDWELKLDLISDQVLREDITNITGVCSWVLVLLNKILEKSGSENIQEVWPNLELYMHGGVNFSPYKNQFEKLITKENMNYLEGYNASEGFFGIQDQIQEKDLLLMLDYGIFYEFIPLDKFNKGNKEALCLKDVSLNTTYVIVISTNAGLWRYIIGDTVRFTSLDPYRIKIVGRTQSYLNAVGEELMVENADEALKICAEKHNCTISNYIVSPFFINEAIAVHKWIIEFVRFPASKSDFMRDLDDSLKKLNSDYESKRYKDYLLLPPELIDVKKGIFYNWLSKNNRLGGQYKVPRLDNSTKIFLDILQANRTY